MKEQWLVLWAGSEANWGRLDVGGAFGPHVETGQISSSLAISRTGARGLGRQDGLRDDEFMLDLSTELDVSSYCRAVHALPPPAMVLAKPCPPGTAPPLALPHGAALLRIASEHVLQQLRGKQGVIAVPAAWQVHPWGGAVLTPWIAAGWRGASWEACTAKELSGARRISVAAGGWARLNEPSGNLLIPTSAAVATAAGLAPLVRAGMMTVLAAAHGGPIQGCSGGAWFTEARLRSLIADGLQRRLDHIVVGGAEAPVFTFAGTNLNDQQVAVSHARVRVSLPLLRDSDWWEVLATPGALSLPDGTALPYGLDWPARSSVVLGAQPAERRLHLSFQMSGYPSVILTPPTLPMFGDDDVQPPPPQLPQPPPPQLPQPPPPPPPPPPVAEDVSSVLANYRAGFFRVARPHRGVRARVDGEPRSVTKARPGAAIGPAEYCVEPSGLPQRALVRIDYEPEPEA